MATIGIHPVTYSGVHAVYPGIGELTVELGLGVSLTLRFTSNSSGQISGNATLNENHATLDLVNYDNPLGSTYDMQITLEGASTLNVRGLSPSPTLRRVTQTAVRL